MSINISWKSKNKKELLLLKERNACENDVLISYKNKRKSVSFVENLYQNPKFDLELNWLIRISTKNLLYHVMFDWKMKSIRICLIPKEIIEKYQRLVI